MRRGRVVQLDTSAEPLWVFPGCCGLEPVLMVVGALLAFVACANPANTTDVASPVDASAELALARDAALPPSEDAAQQPDLSPPIPKCQDECPEVGRRRCSDELVFATCGDHDTDPCLEWGAPQNCPPGAACQGGGCIAEGFDWWLPKGVTPPPYSGFVTWSSRFSEMITVARVDASWKEVCPAPGVYDWQSVIDQIAANSAKGMRSGIHFRSVQVENVPEWVKRDFDVPTIDVIPLTDNQPWRIQIVPPWHPDVRREFEQALVALGQTGIPKMSEVVYAYMHGVGPSRGEELWLRPQDIADWEEKAGLTSDVFVAWLRGRLDRYLSAFAGVEHKLAWMAAGPVGPAVQYPGYREKTADLLDEALGSATGWRHGGVDFQHRHFHLPTLGTSLTPEGYVEVDESNPVLRERRYFGEENEEYGPKWEWRFGPYAQHEYRHRISTLRVLHTRFRFVAVSQETLKLNAELSRYAALTLGTLLPESPDAWAYLREGYIAETNGTCTAANVPFRCCTGDRQGSCTRQAAAVKNLEKGLIQRDIPGHRSVPTERVDRVGFTLPTDPVGFSYDFDARRTDIRNGQAGLAFTLDEDFWTHTQPAIFKVTYLDREPTDWHVEYTDGSGALVTAPVTNSGTGKRVTVTFFFPSLSAQGAFAGQTDVRIVSDGPGDVVVTLVRVVKAPIPPG